MTLVIALLAASLTGSLVMVAPGAMSVPRAPEKVTFRSVPGSTSAPARRAATVTDEMRSGVSPKRLDRTSRTAEPAAVGLTISRTVWSSR